MSCHVRLSRPGFFADRLPTRAAWIKAIVSTLAVVGSALAIVLLSCFETPGALAQQTSAQQKGESNAISTAPSDTVLPKSEKMRVTGWYKVYYFKFKHGKVEAAHTIIDKLVMARRAVKREPLPFFFVTGDWDHMVILPLQDGPAELAWSLSPNDEAWWKALAEIEGSPQAAKDLVAEFRGSIARRKMDVLYRRH